MNKMKEGTKVHRIRRQSVVKPATAYVKFVQIRGCKLTLCCCSELMSPSQVSTILQSASNSLLFP